MTRRPWTGCTPVWRTRGCCAGGFRGRLRRHSPQIGEIREDLLTLLSGIAPRPSRVPFCSTVTGGLLDTTALDATYWYRNLRTTVRFAEAVRSLLDAGHRAFVEISTHPTLTYGTELSTAGSDAEPHGDIAVIGTLRRDEGGPGRMLCPWARRTRPDCPSTGPRPSRGPAPAAASCPPTPSSAAGTGSTRPRRPPPPPTRPGAASVTLCWVPSWTCPARTPFSRGGCPWPAIPGWPTTPSRTRSCCPAWPFWRWRPTRAADSAASWSRS
ncbi:acyltransferase domain-containing protein [Streptomyces clavuligerus]|nr:acyltransferase domain-containing protein [Streptomyces clavuligerus]